MVEMSMKTVGPVRSAGILQQNRVFLDFFWDLAKPEQEVRLKAIEDLIQYLKTNNKVSQHVPEKFCNTFLYTVNQLNTLRCLQIFEQVFSLQMSCCCSTICKLYITSKLMLLMEPGFNCS